MKGQQGQATIQKGAKTALFFWPFHQYLLEEV